MCDKRDSGASFRTAIITASLAGAALATLAQSQSSAPAVTIANVTSYGADPSGAKDSTQAFVAAIASGKTVYVPTGNYTIANHDVLVMATAQQKLYGDGPTASLLNYMGPCESNIQTAFSVLTLRAPHETVSALGITSHESAKCRMLGIHMISTDGLVDNVAVSQMWHHGIAVQGSHNSVIDCDVEYNYYGVALGGDHQLLRGCYISNHYSTSGEPRPWTEQSMYWDGVVSDGLTDSVIDGNTVEDNGQSGIYTGSNQSVSYGNVITNNIVSHNRNNGIDQGVSGPASRSSHYVGSLTIAGNKCTDNWNEDIWLNEIDGAVVANNYAAHTADYPHWWGSDTKGAGYVPNTCEVWDIDPSSKDNNIIFVDNTCDQYDPKFAAIVFYPGAGTGNILGQNTTNQPVNPDPRIDRTRNVILPSTLVATPAAESAPAGKP
jgi:hypothetical protein